MGCWHARLLGMLGRTVAALSPRAAQRFAALLARLPLVNARRRRIAAANIALCFPRLDPGARQRLLQRVLASNITGLLEALRAWFAPAGTLAGTVRIDGLEHLQAALDDGRGAVVVCAHYDGFELAMRHVAEASRGRMRIQARRQNDACIEAEVSGGRGRYAGPTIDKKDVAGLAAAVRAGQGVFYLPDQDAARRNVFVPFMGVPAATLGVIGGVLARAGGTVLLMWATREADGRQRIDLRPAWADWPGADETANAARYMDWIGERLQAAPEQYLWVHRRFKTRPPGEAPVYR